MNILVVSYDLTKWNDDGCDLQHMTKVFINESLVYCQVEYSLNEEFERYLSKVPTLCLS